MWRALGRSRRLRPIVITPLNVAIFFVALGSVFVVEGRVSLPQIDWRGMLGGRDTVSYSFAPCTGRGGTCVVDGDTIRIEGQPVRIADIDTPEVRDYGCPAEKALGDRATLRMTELLNAGPFELERQDSRDTDVYGRQLRVVTRNGESLGMILVAEGLARPWDGARRSWCG